MEKMAITGTAPANKLLKKSSSWQGMATHSWLANRWLVKPAMVVMLGTLLLAGCGGGSDNSGSSALTPPANTDQPPANPSPNNSNNPGGNTGNNPNNSGNPTPNDPNQALSLCGNSTSIQELLDKLNRYRSEARNCGKEFYPAVPALVWNKNLAKAAQGHSDDMAANNYFSHTGLNGSTIGDRAIAAGYNFRYQGENIAAGQQTIDEVMQAWIKSPGHCANIMNANYREYGMACASNSQSTYKKYWTQEFGSR